LNIHVIWCKIKYLTTKHSLTFTVIQNRATPQCALVHNIVPNTIHLKRYSYFCYIVTASLLVIHKRTDPVASHLKYNPFTERLSVFGNGESLWSKRDCEGVSKCRYLAFDECNMRERWWQTFFFHFFFNHFLNICIECGIRFYIYPGFFRIFDAVLTKLIEFPFTFQMGARLSQTI
jgi:hypothetical protein